MRILCIGGGPAGLYLALLLKKADPRHVIRVVERNRPYDTFGWGVVFSDQTLGNLEAADPDDRARDRRRVQSLGRHRRPFQGHDDHLRRPRLLRHRPQAAAQHPAAALRGARRRARVRDRRRRRCEAARAFAADLVVAADGAQQPHPDALRRRVRARRRRAALPVRLARHEEAFEAFTFAFDETRARLVPGARLPIRRRHLDVHRRDARGRLAEGGPRPDDRSRKGIAFCERLFAPYLDGEPLMSNARTCAARRSGSASRASSAARGCTGRDRRRATCRSC